MGDDLATAAFVAILLPLLFFGIAWIEQTLARWLRHRGGFQ
jgi:hypothetical protein